MTASICGMFVLEFNYLKKNFMENDYGKTERELIEQRKKKLRELASQGINPYPSKSNRNFSTAQVRDKEDKLISEKKEVTVAGRLMAERGHGKLVFADLLDESGKIQIVFKEDILGEAFENLHLIDPGDFIEATGTVFTTKAGELSIEVKSFKVLTKALRPLPEKWYGLKDEETRLRKRYLEFLLEPELKNLFEKKAKFWQSTRNFLINKGFLEVETPVFETTAGGADANPFITHHNALDIDVYLRISMGELWQKRLMVAGFEKTFEIGRQFRNEGISREHLQDYSQMEFYWAYANYEDSMNLVREMYQYVAQETFGTLKFKINEFDVDLSGEWPKIDYTGIIKEKIGIDVLSSSDEEIKAKLRELGLKFNEKDRRGRLIDILWKQIRKSIAGPAFLINHPVEVSPLAKRKTDDPRLVERYQVILAGSEMGNGYSELNDPIDQAERFREQAKMREEGDTEAQMNDYDFVEALEYGMPPTTGFGCSERLFSFLANRSVREAVLFPLMKPVDKKIGKSKNTELVTVVLNKEANLNNWQKLNTVAHLNASFAARTKNPLFVQDAITTKDKSEIKLNIQHAIIIKEADSGKELIDLIDTAKSEGLEVCEFIREMIETSDDKKIAASALNKDISDIEFLGVLVYGEKRKVEEVTSKFNLVK